MFQAFKSKLVHIHNKTGLKHRLTKKGYAQKRI